MAAYNILNLAHGWCISGQSNGGAYALFYPPQGKLYNAWTFSQAASGYWTIAKADDPSKVLVGSDNYCYYRTSSGQEAQWSIDAFSDGLKTGVPFQLINVKNPDYAAVAPESEDSIGTDSGVNTYFEKPNSKQLYCWWALVLPLN